ncbi:MAG TPA: hypothetical protein VK558_06870 [Patescibacteria group bacterium]|nr:hypothetical protein [Patescibacteria group bacterium]
MEPRPDIAAAYRRGQLDEARALANAAIATAPDDEFLCFILAVCAVRLHRPQEILAVLTHWASRHNDRGVLCNRVLRQLLDDRHYAELLAVLDGVPREAPWHILCLYYAGCALMMTNRRAEAFPLFQRFRETLPHYMAHVDFLENTELNVIFRQGRLIAGGEDLRQRLETEAPVPAVTFLSPPLAQMDGVLFAACNSGYFNAMGERFVDAMAELRGPTLGIHVHVAGPDQASRELMERLTLRHGAAVAFSIEEPPLVASVTYYSCARFFVMEEMLGFHGKDILCLDLDQSLTLPPQTLLAQSRGYDFCCFSTDRNDPASIYWATIMSFPHGNARTLSFIDVLRRFCWRELSNPSFVNWMLDQAALYSLLSDPGIREGLRFGDFRSLMGLKLSEVSVPIISEGEKFGLKDRIFRAEGVEVDLLPEGPSDQP